MLKRAAMRANQMMLAQKQQNLNFAKMTGARSIVTVPGKSYVVPESVDDVVQYLDSTKPTFTCLYFHAGWNPICEKIDADYDNFCRENG